MFTIRRSLVSGVIGALALTSLVACGTQETTQPASSTAPVTATQGAAPGTTEASKDSAVTAPSATDADQETGDYNSSDPTPAAPDQLSLDSRITPDGFGPYTLGLTKDELLKRGMAIASTQLCEGSIEAITTAKTLGLHRLQLANDRLDAILVEHPRAQTDKGAKVGMTMAEVAGIYGGSFGYVDLTGQSTDTTKVARVAQGNHEILFLPAINNDGLTDAKPTDAVASMVIRTVTTAGPFLDAC